LPQLSDEALLQLIAERDAVALETLYDRHAQMIHNLITRIVRDPAVAAELLQETFWQVWQACGQGQFRGEGVALAWLCRIARNKALDQLRRQKARPQPVATESEEDEQQLWDQFVALKWRWSKPLNRPGTASICAKPSKKSPLNNAAAWSWPILKV
jgi:RNA polymerase sigma-70 factor (ECF subfamily)